LETLGREQISSRDISDIVGLGIGLLILGMLVWSVCRILARLKK
jgi:hypothetical protein